MDYIVTSIADIKHSYSNKKKLVYINYEPAFALYNKELKTYNVKENEALSEQNYSDIVQMLSKRATVRAMNLLKTKDYTQKELINKLELSYYPKKSIDDALTYVERYGYINDKRYVENYIAFKASKKSRKQIEQLLKEKGIDSDIIESALEAYYGDSSECEEGLILSMLKKKYGNIPMEELDYKQKQKMMAYMYRKGFSMDQELNLRLF